jgi:hypothetical protein
MKPFERTLISFVVFLITFTLVATVHQDVNGPNQMQHVLVWIVFFAMTTISLIKWEATWLFASFAVLYTIMIGQKAGVSRELAAAAGTSTLMMLAFIGFEPVRRLFTPLATFGHWVIDHLLIWTRSFRRRRHLTKLRCLAGVKKGGENLSGTIWLEFEELDRAVVRIGDFYDGSDPALEKVLQDTPNQIDRLQRDHARMLLRSAHLQSLIAGEPRLPIDGEINRLTTEHGKATDKVVKAQLGAMIEMKQKRLAELEKLETCLKRVEMQRLQIIDTVQATFNRLNSLKFSDIQVLEASRDAITSEIRTLQTDLDQFERGLLAAESSSSR